MRRLIIFTMQILPYYNIAYSAELASTPMLAPAINATDSKPVIKAVDDIVMGSSDAPVTIVEYSSLNCIACALFHRDVLPQIKKKYIDTGKVRFVFRHFPLDERAAEVAAIVSCAPPIKQSTLVQRLFSQQSAWMNVEAPAQKLSEITGMSLSSCQAAMKNKQLTDAVFQKRLDAERDLPIEGTPTFTVNDKIIDIIPTLENFEPYLNDTASVPSKDNK